MLTGFESLHGSIHQMALKIKQRVKDELGIIASIGIATCKVVAKVASDESKPDGLIEVRQTVKPHSWPRLPSVNYQVSAKRLSRF